jgi:hypothetical protein
MFAGTPASHLRWHSDFLFREIRDQDNEPGILSGLIRAHRVVTSARDDMTRKVSGTALGPDLGTIEFPASSIGTETPRLGHTRRLARMYATDAERAFDRLSGVVHLPHWP